MKSIKIQQTKRKKMILTVASVLLVAIVSLFGTGKGYAASVFGTSEDAKALGYPDGRKIVRDSGGNLYAAFRKKHGSPYQIFVSKSINNGATWTVPSSPISTVAGNYHQRVPSIAIDNSNVLHVVWYGQDNSYSGANERQIKYSRSNDGGATWSSWVNIAPVNGYAGESLWQEHPVIYVAPNGHLYVVWEGRDPGSSSMQAKFIRSVDGGNTWTGWKNIASSSTNQSRPTLVLDSAGKIFVIAYGYWAPSGRQNIIYSTSADGGVNFSSWAAVAADGTNEQRHASAAIDSGNKIHLVWRQQDAGTGANTVIKYSKFTDPSWSSGTVVAETSGYYQFFPSIANSHGSQYVVWTETGDASGYPSENPSTGRIVLAKRLKGATVWSKSNLTPLANNVFGSIRWSIANMNGGTIDVVYSSGSTSPFQLKYESLGTWGS